MREIINDVWQALVQWKLFCPKIGGKRDSQRGLNHLNHLLGQRYEGDVVLVWKELQLEEDSARGQRHDDHLSVVLNCALIMPFEANSAWYDNQEHIFVGFKAKIHTYMHGIGKVSIPMDGKERYARRCHWAWINDLCWWPWRCTHACTQDIGILYYRIQDNG